MGTAWVECWKCDECGHRWIKGELYPAQCAKCRSRKWNAGAGKDDSCESQALPSGTCRASMGTVVKSPAVAKEPQPAPPKISMDELRSICAGNVHQQESPIESEISMCSYTEYDTDTGETYRCRLPVHGPKIKHRRGAAL